MVMVEAPCLDNLINALAELLDDCSDDLSRAGDGCSRCSCRGDCDEFWEKVEPKKDNRLSREELRAYTREFQQIRGRRQLLMFVTV